MTITPLKLKFPPVEFALAWWAKIITSQPSYLYFFGPFTSKEEAKSHCTGYREDLESEGASIVTVDIEYCQPTNITAELN